MLQKKHAQKEDTSVVQNIEDDIKRSLGLEKPLPPPPQPQQNRVRDNDLSAFKKLVIILFIRLVTLANFYKFFSVEFF